MYRATSKNTSRARIEAKRLLYILSERKKMTSNTSNANFRLKVLSTEQIQKIHKATLDVLQHVGIQITEPQSLALLEEAGADISDTKRIKIPPSVVEKAIQQAPDNVLLYNRNGQQALQLTGTNIYYGAHGDCPSILDPVNSQRRNFLAEDAATIAKVCDYLPQIDFISLNGFADDCLDPKCAVPLNFVKMVTNTTKPLGFSCDDEEVYDKVLDIAGIVAGGKEQLRQKPFLYHFCEPISPLVHGTPSLRKIIKSVESGIPVVYYPMPMVGTTAPCSFTGTLILANAESLTGLIITQLLEPGASFIYGGIPGIMDMRTTIYSYGAPEMLLMVKAMTDMAHHYKLPMFGTAGCSDAKIVDQQAAIEATLSCHCAALSGANLIHDIGFLDHAVVVSAEMMVLCDEIIAMIKQTLSQFDVMENDMIIDLIDKVGPGGNYLAEEHTLANFRKNWSPTLMDRTRFEEAQTQQTISFSEISFSKVFGRTHLLPGFMANLTL